MLSVVPMRVNPTHRAEMCSQLLFGEHYSLLATRDGWLQIRCSHDQYEGWIDSGSHTSLSERDMVMLTPDTCGIAIDLFWGAASVDRSMTLVCGSSLPGFDGINFRIGKEKFIYNGQALQPDNPRPLSLIEKLAMKYLYAPYLWGGRSPVGIDCSGFSQILYKCLGIAIPRDAYQQAEVGQVVNFVEESCLGDLAFFHNEDGKITHVGVVLKDQKIIHASGFVRIDTIDHFGIFNHDTGRYSHRLKIIKRITH